MRKAVILILGGLLFTALIVIIQLNQIAVYHDGRCGTQQWIRWILIFDHSERDYDEFAIAERWAKAHDAPCKHIWVKGPLYAGASPHWPPLHFSIAAGARIDRIRREIGDADRKALFHTDPLGRSIMHWLAIHPDIHGREILINELLDQGLSFDLKNNDGLSPRDWQSNSLRSERESSR